MKTISELKRNDVKGAMEVYKAAATRNGAPPSAEITATLLRLQDDPGALMDAFEEYNEANGFAAD